MAISVAIRPRKLAYYNEASPPTPIYSIWSAAWNSIVYEFVVPNDNDKKSAIVISIYENSSNTLLAVNTYRPFKNGNLIVDLSPYIKAYLYSKYFTSFGNDINCIDNGNSINIYITYSQIFDDGSSVLFTSEQQRPISVSCSAQQFGDKNDGNMINYTPFNTDLPEAQKMKFLTAFEKPMMFKGYPFTLSFIYSTNLIGYQVAQRTEEQDINSSQLIVINTDLNPNLIGRVNYLKINEPTQQNTKKIIVSLSTGDAVDNRYVDVGYVDNGYEQIQ